MFQFLVISFKESVKDYRVYLPWDSQVTAEVWTMTFKKSPFTCIDPGQNQDFPAISNTLFKIHAWSFSVFVQHPSFMPAKETGEITDLRACFSLNTDYSHIYCTPSKQYCIFFCPQLNKTHHPDNYFKKSYAHISSNDFCSCNCYSGLLRSQNFVTYRSGGKGLKDQRDAN